MLAGEPIKPHCDWCYIDEAKGLTSMRQNHSKDWLESKYGKEIMERIKTSRSNAYRVNKQPLYLDLNFSSLCNLQCRMCDARQSSKIKQDQKKLIPGLQRINNYKLWHFLKPVNYFHPVSKHIEWDKKNTLWKTLYKWAPGVKKLYLTGGEPLLVKENWTLIDYLKEKGYSKDIHLAFNTNCTVALDKIIDTFKHFRFVEVRFSIDGYKETQEYIRYPSKWKNVERNTIKILKNKTKNTSLYFVPVVQIYNILDMPRFFKWIDRLLAEYKISPVSANILIYPECLNIDILPDTIKRIALKQISNCTLKNISCFSASLDQIIKALKAKNKRKTPWALRQFFAYTKVLDQHRGNSFEQTFPELNTLLNEDGRWKVDTDPV